MFTALHAADDSLENYETHKYVPFVQLYKYEYCGHMCDIGMYRVYIYFDGYLHGILMKLQNGDVMRERVVGVVRKLGGRKRKLDAATLNYWIDCVFSNFAVLAFRIAYITTWYNRLSVAGSVTDDCYWYSVATGCV